MVRPPPGLSDLCSDKDVCVCVRVRCVVTFMALCVCLCVSLQCRLGLSSPPPLPLQAHVEASELLQEAWVWTDVSVRPDGSHRLLQPQALHNHQESQHQSGRAAHTHQTVDKHPSCGGTVAVNLSAGYVAKYNI